MMQDLIASNFIGELRWDCACGKLNVVNNMVLTGNRDHMPRQKNRVVKCVDCGKEYGFYLGVV